MKMSLICMKMNLLAEHISIGMVSPMTRFETEVKGNSEVAYWKTTKTKQ